MRVFMTGATGYIGTLVAQDLINNEVEVLGLTRSQRSADKLTQMGGIPVMGTLEDLDVLKTSAQKSDAVLHLGFVNDFEHFAQASRIDAEAIESFGEVLKGTDKPLIVTAGTAGLNPNHVLTEEDTGFTGVEKVIPRRSEFLARELVEQGINAYTVRLAPSVHGDGRYGIVSIIVAQAQKTGKVPYFGDWQNRWNAVNYRDAANLFVKALEYALGDNHSLHVFNAVGEGQTKTIDIAKAISQKLNLPMESQPEIDFANLSNEDAFNVNNLFGLDIPADSKMTQKELTWQPSNLSLIADLEKNL